MVEIKNQYTGREKLKLPKNIRQIGTPGTEKKVYVEDYVVTYMNQLAKDSGNRQAAAILLGFYTREDNVCLTFVNGAVAIPEAEVEEDQIAFDSELWEKLYDTIRTYFKKAEIVGWFLTRPGKSLGINEKITKIHVDQFPGAEKTLFLMDPLDREDAFFIYENGRLTRQHGYYIYYERNEDMQNYMVESRKRPTTDLQTEPDSGYRNRFEKISAAAGDGKRKEKAQKAKKAAARLDKAKKDEKRSFRLSYAATALAAMCILLVGMAFVNRFYVGPQAEPAGNISNEPSEETISIQVIEGNVQNSESTDNSTGENITENSLGESLQESSDGLDVAQEGTDAQDDENASAVNAGASVKRYTVQAGDTLANISISLYDTRDYVDTICEMNDIENPDLIYEGMVLELP